MLEGLFGTNISQRSVLLVLHVRLVWDWILDSVLSIKEYIIDDSPEICHNDWKAETSLRKLHILIEECCACGEDIDHGLQLFQFSSAANHRDVVIDFEKDKRTLCLPFLRATWSLQPKFCQIFVSEFQWRLKDNGVPFLFWFPWQ